MLRQNPSTGRSNAPMMSENFVSISHAGVALLEGVTDLVKVKALIKAAVKGLKEYTSKTRKTERRYEFGCTS